MNSQGFLQLSPEIEGTHQSCISAALSEFLSILICAFSQGGSNSVDGHELVIGFF